MMVGFCVYSYLLFIFNVHLLVFRGQPRYTYLDSLHLLLFELPNKLDNFVQVSNWGYGT